MLLIINIFNNQGKAKKENTLVIECLKIHLQNISKLCS